MISLHHQQKNLAENNCKFREASSKRCRRLPTMPYTRLLMSMTKTTSFCSAIAALLACRNETSRSCEVAFNAAEADSRLYAVAEMAVINTAITNVMSNSMSVKPFRTIALLDKGRFETCTVSLTTVNSSSPRLGFLSPLLLCHPLQSYKSRTPHFYLDNDKNTLSSRDLLAQSFF